MSCLERLGTLELVAKITDIHQLAGMQALNNVEDHFLSSSIITNSAGSNLTHYIPAVWCPSLCKPDSVLEYGTLKIWKFCPNLISIFPRVRVCLKWVFVLWQERPGSQMYDGWLLVMREQDLLTPHYTLHLTHSSGVIVSQSVIGDTMLCHSSNNGVR